MTIPDADNAGRSGGYPWLFSARIDLAAFGGSALAAFVALAIGSVTGVLHSDTPDWAWVPAVLMIDVAHVYLTTFRVYLDPFERRRRPWLYALTPIASFAVLAWIHRYGDDVFWRALAYAAVFHFVRQQRGWVALYRARAGDRTRLGTWLDDATIYATTVYPLLWWHAHLPRAFWWFRTGDFVSLPVLVSRVAAPVYFALLTGYAARAVWLYTRGAGNPGKDLVVATTALCWYVGIVAISSDYAFTVTNVIIHAVPYFALVYLYGRARVPTDRRGYHWFAHGPWRILAAIWALAYLEEMLWDRAVWQERAWLFGAPFEIGSLRAVLVPLLATPALTHYALDGFVWKRRSNPTLATTLGITGER